MKVNKQLRLLRVVFDTKLRPWDLEPFRGAVAHKVGLEHDWFHNHNNESEGSTKLHYRYPLIQYKLHHERPMLLCLERGVEEAQRFFQQPDWNLNIKGDTYSMRVRELDVRSFELKTLELPASYRIHNWLALNQENHKKYQSLRGMVERIQFLENLLVGHFLSFAKGVDWEVEQPLHIRVVEKFEDKRISFKGIKMQAFNLIFETNAFIPHFVGLGKGVSHGFGVVKHP